MQSKLTMRTVTELPWSSLFRNFRNFKLFLMKTYVSSICVSMVVSWRISDEYDVLFYSTLFAV